MRSVTHTHCVARCVSRCYSGWYIHVQWALKDQSNPFVCVISAVNRQWIRRSLRALALCIAPSVKNTQVQVWRRNVTVMISANFNWHVSSAFDRFFEWFIKQLKENIGQAWTDKWVAAGVRVGWQGFVPGAESITLFTGTTFRWGSWAHVVMRNTVCKSRLSLCYRNKTITRFTNWVCPQSFWQWTHYLYENASEP